MVFDKYNYSLLGLVQLGRRSWSAHQHQPLPGSQELLGHHLPFLRLFKPSGVGLGAGQFFA